jgi:hypothetical protein
MVGPAGAVARDPALQRQPCGEGGAGGGEARAPNHLRRAGKADPADLLARQRQRQRPLDIIDRVGEVQRRRPGGRGREPAPRRHQPPPLQPRAQIAVFRHREAVARPQRRDVVGMVDDRQAHGRSGRAEDRVDEPRGLRLRRAQPRLQRLETRGPARAGHRGAQPGAGGGGVQRADERLCPICWSARPRPWAASMLFPASLDSEPALPRSSATS